MVADDDENEEDEDDGECEDVGIAVVDLLQVRLAN